MLGNSQPLYMWPPMMHLSSSVCAYWYVAFVRSGSFPVTSRKLKVTLTLRWAQKRLCCSAWMYSQYRALVYLHHPPSVSWYMYLFSNVRILHPVSPLWTRMYNENLDSQVNIWPSSKTQFFFTHKSLEISRILNQQKRWIQFCRAGSVHYLPTSLHWLDLKQEVPSKADQP